MKYGPEKDPTAFAKFVAVGSYYDSMGMLLKTKNISVEYLPKLMIIAIIDFREKIAPIADELALAMRHPESYDNIKHLYSEVRKHDLVITK